MFTITFIIIIVVIFLGGLLLCVQDSTIFEESQNDVDSNAQSDTTSNLLSSGIFK